LNHLPMVASVTDSPNAGTRISAMGYPDVRCRMTEMSDQRPESKSPAKIPIRLLTSEL
jgi:hypothetical protein